MKKLENINSLFIFLSISLFLFFLFLALRNTGLYPSVFADEYTYSKLSRLMPLSEATIPSYLYLKLYSVTNYCGDGFLGCAKIINSFLFIAAAPFIFFIARRVTSDGVSAYISTLLSIIGPINSYTAYFMPESFYFLSFWVFCWYLLNLDCKSGNYRWFAAGTIYGISSLIKPHSLLYLPAILLYVVFVFYRVQLLFSKASGMALVSLMLGVGVAKFGISYILAGSSGLTIFGPFYGATVSSVSAGSDKYIELLLLSLESFKGHMLVVGLIYGLPFVLVVAVTIKTLFARNNHMINSESQAAQYEKLAFLSLVVILNLICVVALFTASVANSGPYETPYRLHMRYYNFALPLFYLIVAASLSVVNVKRSVRYILGGIFVAMGIVAIWSNLVPYTPSHVDSPEIRGLHANHLYFQVVGGLLISSLVIWIVSQRRGLYFYLYLALPLFVFISNYHVGLELNNRLKQDIYDKAGIFTKQYLTNDALSRVVIIGSEAGGLFRSLYYLDNAKASIEIIERGSDYDLTKLPDGKEWALVIGDHEVKGTSFYKIPMNGFVLIRASGDNVLDFRKDAWPGIITKVRGLSTPEPWGTWSQSDVVVFEFAGSLPSKFEIHLVAHAFANNVNKEFEVSVGDVASKFSLSANDEEKIIYLDNPTGSNVLYFKIPNAVSPKSLGLSEDDRNLGIGFVEMKIVPIK